MGGKRCMVTSASCYRLRWHSNSTCPRKDGWTRIRNRDGGDGSVLSIRRLSDRPWGCQSSRSIIVFGGERIHRANQTVGRLEGIGLLVQLKICEQCGTDPKKRAERHTSVKAAVVSFGSLKTIDWFPSLKRRFLKFAGVGVEARGYCLASRSFMARGGLIRRGGKEVVVVVVVVTTVVRVVGANENWPKESLLEGPCPFSS